MAPAPAPAPTPAPPSSFPLKGKPKTESRTTDVLPPSAFKTSTTNNARHHLLSLHRPSTSFPTLNAIDHIINSAAKSNYMSAGQINVPIVFRGPDGHAAGVGSQHSQCYGAWYGSVPGLKVLVLYSSEDAHGLLKAAIRDPDPVVFLENELLYGESFPVSAEALDSSFCLPIGKAKIDREGKDITITAFSKMVGYAFKEWFISKMTDWTCDLHQTLREILQLQK